MSLTQTNPLLAVVGQMLDIAGGRAEGSRILDLLASDPVRRRFALTENDLETITGWVENAGIRWSFDAAAPQATTASRSTSRTPGGSGSTGSWPGSRSPMTPSDSSSTTLPLDDVASTSIDLAGRLAEAIDRLQRVTDELAGEHPVNHWLDTISVGVDAADLGLARRRVAAWPAPPRACRAGNGSPPRAGPMLRLPDVRALMGERLAGRPTRANFRTGTLTVCTMTPMRSVPHRVVCLLGMDDGVFPRAGAVDGDDLLARDPLTGERDLRSEDRQLMLDAMMATSRRWW